MNYILLVFFIFECISLFSATYMFMLGDWNKVIEKRVFEDYGDYIIASFVIAVLLGWIVAPIFIVTVLKNNQ